MERQPIPDPIRVYLDSRPAPFLVPEKVLAYLTGKAHSTVRGWRNDHRPSFEPPEPIRIRGRVFYAVADVVAFVQRTGIVNKELLENP